MDLLAWLLCLVSAVSAEVVLNCSHNLTVWTIDDNEYVRVVSENYSAPYVYYTGYCTSCWMSILARSGRDLKISFINSVYNQVDLYGINGTECYEQKQTVDINTPDAYGTNFGRYTYHAGRNLTLVAYGGMNPYGWQGFQAIVSVERDETCTNNTLLNLLYTNGPIIFGTNWKNRTTPSGANVCSWVIAGVPSDKSVKIFVIHAKTRNGEALYITDSRGGRTTIEQRPKPYYFTDVESVTVVYERNGPDSEVYGIAALASWMDKPSYSSGKYCSNQTANFSISFHKRDYNYCERDCEYEDLTKYADYTECSQSFKVIPGWQVAGSFIVTSIEKFCDTIELITDSSVISVGEGEDTNYYYVFSHDTINSVTVKWKSDGSAGFDGFSGGLDMTDCKCERAEISLTPNGVFFSSNAEEVYCNNIHCEHKVYAPPGFYIFGKVTAWLRNISGETLTVDDGRTILARFKNEKRAETVVSSSGFMNLVFDSKAYPTPLSLDSDYSWTGQLEARKDLTVTSVLDAAFPAVVKRASIIEVWTITAVNQVILFGISEFEGSHDAIKFEVRDGGLNGTLIGSLGDLEQGKTLMSTTHMLTIVDTLRSPALCFDVYASDSAEVSECNLRPVVVRRDFEWNAVPVAVQVNASQTPCSVSIAREVCGYCDRNITLYNINATLGPNKEPIRLIAGPYRRGNVNEVELFAFRDDWNKYSQTALSYKGNLMTILLPEGSALSATAVLDSETTSNCQSLLFKDAYYTSSVDFGAEGFLTSYLYPEPNFLYYHSEHYSLVCVGGATNISVELTVDLPNKAALLVNNTLSKESLWFTNTSFEGREFTFETDSLVFVYTRVMQGEKGFLMKYRFGGSSMTTAVTLLNASSSISTTKSLPSSTESRGMLQSSAAVPPSNAKPSSTTWTSLSNSIVIHCICLFVYLQL